MKRLLILFISFGICLNVNAETRGMVASDCGMFIEKDRNREESLIFAYRMSFLSYLSALEVTSGLNKLKGVSTDSIYYSVLQICKEKPLQRIDESLLKFYYSDLK